MNNQKANQNFMLYSRYFRSAFLYSTNIIFDRVDRFVSLRYYKDEVLLSVEMVLQFYFLLKKKATYAEFFYDYFRQQVDQNKKDDKQQNQILGSQQMQKRIALLVLLLKVVAPYMKNKLDKQFVNLQMKQSQNAGIPSATQFSKTQQLFLKYYPFVSAGVNLVHFFYNTRYLLDQNAQYYDPSNHLLKQQLQRVNELDQIEESLQSHWLIQFMKKYFIFVLFLVTKGMQWYYTDGSNNNNQNSFLKDIQLKNQKVQPPFKKQQLFQSGQTKFCPVCKKVINNPAYLSCSGFVFCYICINDYVENNQKCPVTGVVAKQQNIKKIYAQQ